MASDPVDQILGMVGMDPGSPYGTLSKSLTQASADSKQLSALQWQRQMAGLSRALGYSQNSQNLFNNVYGHPAQAPGATLPQGLQAPPAQPMGQPMGQAPGQMPSATGGAGLQAFLGRGK